jgi:hypothetical protein
LTVVYATGYFMGISAGKGPNVAEDIQGCLQPTEELVGPVSENEENTTINKPTNTRVRLRIL